MRTSPTPIRLLVVASLVVAGLVVAAPGSGAATSKADTRYKTSCGTVYGHTGNTLGYTQFIASTGDGTRSTVVSINSQLTPGRNPKPFAALRTIYGLAVCAALEGS